MHTAGFSPRVGIARAGRGSLHIAVATAQRYRRRIVVRAAEVAAPTEQTTRSFHHGVTYTSYEGNAFVVKFNTSGVRVLVDPWLCGDLTFAEQDWLYKGKKRALRSVDLDLQQICQDTDFILLTQSLDDHTHLPTLRRLDRNLPVVANAAAAEKIAPLGYKSVTVLDHSQSITVCEGKLRITATAGALVGPPWSKRQNGYVLRETCPSPASLYYEPHCDFDAGSLRQAGAVDVVVTPVCSTLMNLGAGAYPLVLGDMNLQQLLRLMQPKVVVPLLNAEIDQEGPLAQLLIERGSKEALQEQLAAAGFKLRLDFPAPPGESMAIAL